MDDKENVKSIFEFIKELGALKTKIVNDIVTQPWYRYVKDIPYDDEYVFFHYRDITADDESEDKMDDDIILSVKKPEFISCPEPSLIIRSWLEPMWDRFDETVKVKKLRLKENIKQEESQSLGVPAAKTSIEETEIDSHKEQFEKFQDNPSRVQAYGLWIKQREKWAENQVWVNRIRELFIELYQLNMDLKQNSETQELMIGNGIFIDKEHPNIHHPILLKRVRITFDAEKNEIFIRDSNINSELYTMVFTTLEGVNHTVVPKLQEDLDKGGYHPLDRNDAYGFMKSLLHSLCAESKFIEENEKIPTGTKDRFFLQVKPVLFMRKKLDGLSKFVDKVIENIDNTGYVPQSIRAIAGDHQEEPVADTSKSTIDQQLAEVGGEDIDILLAKPANREQLAIAQQIEHHNSVLVQGPPGTGKTHTIANLMGHFLANGQSVLVTSYTKKALSVLKDKLPEQLQSLCVSVLDDTNKDMERSVNGITNYIASYNSHELKRKMDDAQQARREIIKKLSDVRKKIYQIQYKEYKDLIYNGEGISPTDAARFVYEHTEEYSNIIPGKVLIGRPLPLSFEEIAKLYHSNQVISYQEEQELKNDLPDPRNIPEPDWVGELLIVKEKAIEHIQGIAKQLNMQVEFTGDVLKLTQVDMNLEILLPLAEKDNIQELQKYLNSFETIEDWNIYAAVDGKRGGGHRNCWNVLCKSIDRTVKISGDVISEEFGKEIIISSDANIEEVLNVIEKMRVIYEESGKISHIKRFFNKAYDQVDCWVKINGDPIGSAEECTLILDYLKLKQTREQCGRYWDDLLVKHGVPKFIELDCSEPENVAQKSVSKIQRYLDWYDHEYTQLNELMNGTGVSLNQIMPENPFANDAERIRQVLVGVREIMPKVCEIQISYCEYNRVCGELVAANSEIERLKTNKAVLCSNLIHAWANHDMVSYDDIYRKMVLLYNKNEVQHKRAAYLDNIYEVAPEWAESIRMRLGIHGADKVPENISEIWKWKQYEAMLQEIINQPFEELQKENRELSQSYRKETARVAEYSAWYHLLQRTEKNRNIQQNLVGWQQITKKIGKGTGKRVPMLRAKAMELMADCQIAVPAWIMTIGTALNSLDPINNQFDVVIVDEASQADISALTMLYLGKKVIIVGDDKQVSPLAVGEELSQVDHLIQMRLEGKVPNATVYTGTTSLYDIGKQICHPLMLREHFRCVPDIIEFSNIYCYDGKIKPLRDNSSCTLLPAVVDYHVSGIRDARRKTNQVEADATVALIQTMANNSEYKNKSIGVISLLGNDQSKLITNLLLKNNVDMNEHDILCGDASQFQGDERDVIILNMVDSNEKETPVRLVRDDKTWQRYNVAVSRAKDQIWIIHSLSRGKDLNVEDVRSYLLKYAANPHELEQEREKIKQKADSPFEEAVAGTLVAHGYDIVQQWPVGKYRIDMVVRDGNEKVALECDGERYHSGEQKVREDMERQTILERLGWHFIRLRGSEYYSNPEQAMIRVMQNLKEQNIQPSTIKTAMMEDTELVQELKRKVTETLNRDEKLSEGIELSREHLVFA